MLGGTATVCTHCTETVCIVDKYAERIFLLEFYDVCEMTQVTGHTEHTLGDNQDAAALLMDMARGGYRGTSAKRCSWAYAPSSSGTLTA